MFSATSEDSVSTEYIYSDFFESSTIDLNKDNLVSDELIHP